MILHILIGKFVNRYIRESCANLFQTEKGFVRDPILPNRFRSAEIHVAAGRKMTVMALKFSAELTSAAPRISDKSADDNFFIFVLVVRALDTF